MKILGQSGVVQRSIDIPIGMDAEGKVLALTIRPIKLTKLLEIDTDIVQPIPPSTGERATNSKGQFIKRNGAPVMVRDDTDDKYLYQMRLWSVAIECARVTNALGDQLKDLPERDKDEAGLSYWLRVRDAYHKCGIDSGIFEQLAQADKVLSEPLSNLEVLTMRKLLGTQDESPIRTDAEEKKLGESFAKAVAEGKPQGGDAPSPSTSSMPASARTG